MTARKPGASKGVTPLELQCGARLKSRDGTCAHTKGWGTNHPGYGPCERHFGNAPVGITMAAKELEIQQRAAIDLAASKWAAPIPGVGGHQVYFDEMATSTGLCVWYRSKLEELVEKSGDNSLIQGILSLQEITGFVGDEDGKMRSGRPYRGGETTKTVGPGVSLWLKLYNEERDRRRKIANEAITLGIEERKLQLESERGERVGHAVGQVLDELGLTEEQLSRAPDIVHRHFGTFLAQFG